MLPSIRRWGTRFRRRGLDPALPCCRTVAAGVYSVTTTIGPIVARFGRRSRASGAWFAPPAGRRLRSWAADAGLPRRVRGGTLCGGCVKRTVKQKRFHRSRRRRPGVLHPRDDFGWDDGLICGGGGTFLAQPVSHDRPDFAVRRRVFRRSPSSRRRVRVDGGRHAPGTRPATGICRRGPETGWMSRSDTCLGTSS